MNKWQIEVQKSLLKSEAEAVKALESQYKRALTDINRKVRDFQAEIDLLDAAMNQDGLDDAARALLQSQRRSKIYQKQYQEALKSQISGILDKMQGDNYSTIESYLKDSYETGYVGTMYDIAKQGIPIITPMNQAAAVRAILVDSKVSGGLYKRLGIEVSALKKAVTQEISRGIATGLGYGDIARNIANATSAPFSRTKTIARTEGHRIQQTSTADAQQAAKDKGADVVKQWDSTLDGKTRDSHRRVDGEIRELDETFSNGLMYPGDPNGAAAEVINCRCASLTRARWALDEEELEELKQRADFFGLDKTENFEEFKAKYLGATDKLTVGETQWISKKGQDNAFSVDAALVNTKEYHDKFEGLTAHKQVNESMYQSAMRILEHRDGTDMEDMVLLDSRTGKVITQNLESQKSGRTGLTDKQYADYLLHSGDVTIIHNHPNGSRVSFTDIRTMFVNKKVNTVVAVGHDGSVYKVFNPNREFDIDNFREMVYSKYLEEYRDEKLAEIRMTDALYNLGVFEFERR